MHLHGYWSLHWLQRGDVSKGMQVAMLIALAASRHVDHLAFAVRPKLHTHLVGVQTRRPGSCSCGGSQPPGPA